MGFRVDCMVILCGGMIGTIYSEQVNFSSEIALSNLVVIYGPELDKKLLSTVKITRIVWGHRTFRFRNRNTRNLKNTDSYVIRIH